MKTRKPKFAEMRSILLDLLEERGWTVKRGLKVPHATAPGSTLRLWFKSQAIYAGHGTDLGDARSLTSDMREVQSVDQLIAGAHRFAGRASGYARTGGARRARTANKRRTTNILVDRKAHVRSAYYRKDGTHVRAAQVKRTRFREVDPGQPGRRARGSKKGPFKREPKWIMRPGMLGGPGYTKKPWKERRRLLMSSIAETDRKSTILRLQVLTRPVALKPETRAVLMHDLRWLGARTLGFGE